MRKAFIFRCTCWWMWIDCLQKSCSSSVKHSFLAKSAFWSKIKFPINWKWSWWRRPLKLPSKSGKKLKIMKSPWRTLRGSQFVWLMSWNTSTTKRDLIIKPLRSFTTVFNLLTLSTRRSPLTNLFNRKSLLSFFIRCLSSVKSTTTNKRP